MSEFGGLLNHLNNPACTTSVSLQSAETQCYVDEEDEQSAQRILSAASQQMLHSRQLQWKGLKVIGILSHCSHALLMQMIQS